MNTTNLFNKPIPVLDGLPDKPKVFWYVSAGQDFRGLVFLTKQQISYMLKKQDRDFIKPDLFLFNCIGPEVPELREKLRGGDAVVYSDKYITLTGKNYVEFGFKSNIIPEVSKEYIDISNDYIPNPENAAFYFEVEIKGKGYTEAQKVLYIEQENIDFFKKVILKEYFEVIYLCATKEGHAFGNCNKSIISYIYEDAAPNFFIDKGFRAKFCIVPTGHLRDIIEKIKKNYSHVITAKNLGFYIYDKGNNNSRVFKFDYK